MEAKNKNYIKLEDETKVLVTKEVYDAYYRPEWREHKCVQRDCKRLLSTDYEYEEHCTLQEFMADTNPGPEDTALNNEMRQFLVQALELLTKDARNLVQETGIARTTINYRREKALKQMREYMEKHI